MATGGLDAYRPGRLPASHRVRAPAGLAGSPAVRLGGSRCKPGTEQGGEAVPRPSPGALSAEVRWLHPGARVAGHREAARPRWGRPHCGRVFRHQEDGCLAHCLRHAHRQLPLPRAGLHGAPVRGGVQPAGVLLARGLAGVGGRGERVLRHEHPGRAGQALHPAGAAGPGCGDVARGGRRRRARLPPGTLPRGPTDGLVVGSALLPGRSAGGRCQGHRRLPPPAGPPPRGAAAGSGGRPERAP